MWEETTLKKFVYESNVDHLLWDTKTNLSDVIMEDLKKKKILVDEIINIESHIASKDIGYIGDDSCFVIVWVKVRPHCYKSRCL